MLSDTVLNPVVESVVNMESGDVVSEVNVLASLVPGIGVVLSATVLNPVVESVVDMESGDVDSEVNVLASLVP